MKPPIGSRGTLNVVLILLGIVAANYLWLSSQQAGRAQSTFDQVVRDRAAIARGALSGCQHSPQVAAALNQDGTCERAQQVINTPLAVTAPEVDYTRVKQIIADLYRANPPRDGKDGDAPTPAQLLPLVQQVYAANPPRDGKTPTDAELLSLIRQVLAENPPRDGADGKNGVDGHDGKSGPQGISISEVRIARDGHSQCILIETLLDPASGSTSEISVAVPDQLCVAAPPSSTPLSIPLAPR